MSKPLNDHEWTLLWSSLLYFCGRETIPSAHYPGLVIEHFYDRPSTEQKAILTTNIKEHLERYGHIGHPTIDEPIWRKFAAALDSSGHVEVTLIDGTKQTVFHANGKIYPLDKYLREPLQEIYIPVENITEGASQ